MTAGTDTGLIAPPTAPELAKSVLHPHPRGNGHYVGYKWRFRNRLGITSGFGRTHAFGTKLNGGIEIFRPGHLPPRLSAPVPKAWHRKTGSYSGPVPYASEEPWPRNQWQPNKNARRKSSEFSASFTPMPTVRSITPTPSSCWWRRSSRHNAPTCGSTWSRRCCSKNIPHPRPWPKASQEDIEKIIASTGFFRNKAKSIRSAAADIVANHAGKVPATDGGTYGTCGGGRKTANVVLGNAFGQNVGVVVDTHVAARLRLGLTKETDPVKVEQDLMKLVPQDHWTLLSHELIFHGRQVCLARKPKCAGSSCWNYVRRERN